MMEGRIVRGTGGLYTVRLSNGESYILRAQKKIRRQHLSLLVGDRVVFIPGSGDEHGWVTEVLPRTSVCLRPPVANISLLVLVVAPQPEPDWLLIDKLLVSARMQDLEAILAINKCDLDHCTAQTAACDYKDASLPVLCVSAATGEGMETLRGHLTSRVSCFAGQSGVGKSTLLNTLFGLGLETNAMSLRISRGKHTTRHTELWETGGMAVLDTPGFSLIELQDGIEPVMLKNYYPEFAPYSGLCRFSPCYHAGEPGCAVCQAARNGNISVKRLGRYQELLKECRKTWGERYE